MAPGFSRTKATTSASDRFSGGGTARPEKTDCVQYWSIAPMERPRISFVNAARTAELLERSTGFTLSPFGHRVELRRKSRLASVRASEPTGLEGCTMTT